MAATNESSTNNVLAQLESHWDSNRFLCVGLDPVLPDDFERTGEYDGAAQQLILQSIDIVRATHHIAAAYKPNSAFFEAEPGGYDLQRDLIEAVHEFAPSVPVIWDAKRGDIGKTNRGYRSAADRLHPQGMTLHPYLGAEALKPLLEDPDRMAFILAKTSNPGAGEFQDVEGKDGRKLWERVAWQIGHDEGWNQGSPLGIVVGATYPDDIGRARKLAGDNITILIPGVGTQGGDLEKSVQNAKNSRGGGFLINVSSGISQPKDESGEPLPVNGATIREAAEKFDMQIVRAL
ncbi:MAG TPA: orotidine-5'-phosphate decarboxylase [Candidatus Saccharimonadales bacterium]|nr:orotidine-5'-phosphate decarboxylase [Candidatus Saccharimonadales bacterium]